MERAGTVKSVDTSGDYISLHQFMCIWIYVRLPEALVNTK